MAVAVSSFNFRHTRHSPFVYTSQTFYFGVSSFLFGRDKILVTMDSLDGWLAVEMMVVACLQHRASLSAEVVTSLNVTEESQLSKSSGLFALQTILTFTFE